MRVALCISGQPRNIDRGIENILQFFKFDFDVFSHSWWDNKSHNKTFKKILPDASGFNFDNGVEDEVSELTQNDWISKLYDNFNVKKILTEEQKQFHIPQNFKDRVIKFSDTFVICSQLYSVHMCNELKKYYEEENGFKYDWVIRSRYDFGGSIPINLDEFNNDYIYAPNDNSHKYGFNDQFAIGSSKNMDIYSNVFPNIESIIDSHHPNIYTANYCTEPDNVGTETILQRHLDNNNVKFKLLDFKNFLFRVKDRRSRIHSIEG